MEHLLGKYVGCDVYIHPAPWTSQTQTRPNRLHTHTHLPKRLAHPRSPIPPLSTLTSRATHAHPTSPRSTGFCAIWDCISSSSLAACSHSRRARRAIKKHLALGKTRGQGARGKCWHCKFQSQIKFKLQVLLLLLLNPIPTERGAQKSHTGARAEQVETALSHAARFSRAAAPLHLRRGRGEWRAVNRISQARC